MNRDSALSGFKITTRQLAISGMLGAIAIISRVVYLLQTGGKLPFEKIIESPLIVRSADLLLLTPSTFVFLLVLMVPVLSFALPKVWQSILATYHRGVR